MMVVSGIDRIRRYSKDGRFGEAQSRIEQALPVYPTSEELHDLLLDLVTRQPALKGWAEHLLAEIQDDTGKREATLARLRGAPLPASDAPAPADKSDDVVAPPDKELPIPVDQPAVGPLPETKPVPGPEGLTDYQRGRAAMNQQPPDLKEAIRWFERVPDTDPESVYSSEQLDILRNQLIPPHLLARIDVTNWRSATDSKLEKRAQAIRDETKAVKSELLAAGAPVPPSVDLYLVRAEELCDQWELTYKLEASLAKGLYRQAWAELGQVLSIGPFQPAEQYRPQLVTVRKAEDELRLIMTRANPKPSDLQAKIAEYQGFVSALSPDDTLHDDQLTTLVGQAQRKLEELIEGRFQQAREEYGASLRTARTLRDVIDRLEVALDILDDEVIALDPNHSDALGLQRKVTSRLDEARALDWDIRAFPKPGDDRCTTAYVDGVTYGLGNLADAELDNLTDAVKFRSQVVDYCVKRAEALVAGASAWNAADQIRYAEAWLGRASDASAAFPNASAPPEIELFRREIDAYRRSRRTARRVGVYGVLVCVVIVTALVAFPSSWTSGWEWFRTACTNSCPN